MSSAQLKREIGIFDAILIGLGSIIGTGVFVSIGIAVNIAGYGVIIAIMLAAVIAMCNGLNSAQLAANHPVSGGTYEYGYKYLKPWLGFTAGWMFLLAKIASAATAALGFSGYFLKLTGFNQYLLIPIALITVMIFTLISLCGVRRTNQANLLIVTITLLGLIVFIIAGLSHIYLTVYPLPNNGSILLAPPLAHPTIGGIMPIFSATALIFVAYSGYARITTMGEEIKEPRRTIPQVIIFCIIITMLIYLGVAIVLVNFLPQLSETLPTAPLESISRYFAIPGISQVVAIAAMTAMLGVLLNLILGLSRVLLAMGRRNDMPKIVARLNANQTSPDIAIVVIGSAIALLVFIGNIKTTWSFSAFSILIYYAIANLASLRLSASERIYPKWLGWFGLSACLFLAFWVELKIWLIGLGLIIAGLIWRNVFKR
jgi:APA family basic amino acid/polyamine antiporter